jgi:hypothetical protein
MLAGTRSCFLLLFVVCFVLASLPVQAQINGVPASVTSLGFGGSSNPAPGVRASVTSLGPNGNGNRSAFGECCANFFLPSNQNPSQIPGQHHHRKDGGNNTDRDGDRDRDRDRDKDRHFVGVFEPAYIPYAVPYAEEADEDDGPPADYVHAPSSNAAGSTARRRADAGSVSELEIPARPQEPVAAQPSTVLIFKDGHQSDVLNYAIVGDTLFDFAEGRTKKILLADLDLPATHKANDDRGVDFQIPANNTRQ